MTDELKPADSVRGRAVDAFTGLAGYFRQWAAMGITGFACGLTVWVVTVDLPKERQASRDDMRQEREVSREDAKASRQHGNQAAKELADSIKEQTKTMSDNQKTVHENQAKLIEQQARMLSIMSGK